MFNLFTKAFSKGGSRLWKSFFWLSITIRIIKWLFRKAQPKIDQQIDLQPGEYIITVEDPKKKKAKKI